MPDISIVIVSWNARRHLAECLASIRENAGAGSPEIVVVDNGSTDGSCEMVRERFPEATLIRNEENLGFARANNIGLAQCSGRYCFLVNSDVIVLPECLEKMKTFLDRNPAVGMAGPRVLNEDRTLQISARRLPTLWTAFCRTFALDRVFRNVPFFTSSEMTWWDHNQTRRVEALSGCFWAVRREVVDSVGGLDEDFFMYSEDIDWCKRIGDAGWEIALNPEAQIVHYGGASSDNAPVRFFLEMEKAGFLYWKKHHGAASLAVYRLLLLLHHVLRYIPRRALYLLRPSRRAELRYKIERSLVCIRWAAGGGSSRAHRNGEAAIR